jgi:hypothetical protein
MTHRTTNVELSDAQAEYRPVVIWWARKQGDKVAMGWSATVVDNNTGEMLPEVTEIHVYFKGGDAFVYADVTRCEKEPPWFDNDLLPDGSPKRFTERCLVVRFES